MADRIVGLTGPLKGQEFVLGGEPLSFGRSSENTVTIADRQASRRHAEVRRHAKGYMLYDKGSSNGTFVNGQRVESHLLQPGDEIKIGEEVFRFVAEVPPPKLEIVGLHGPRRGQRFALEDTPLTFGRSSENTVVISDRQASRRHAEIRPEAKGHVLYDRGSSNGTFVNGQRVESHLLQPDDEIKIGEEVFRLEAEGSGVKAAPAAQRQAAASPMARSSPAQPAPPAGYGIRCPACGRVIQPHYQHCPWDGASLANGQTVITPAASEP